MNSFLDTLEKRAARGRIRTIFFPESEDERILEAASKLKAGGILQPLLISTHEDEAKLKKLGLTCVLVDEGRAEQLSALLMEVRASKKETKDELTLEKACELAHNPLYYGMYLLREGEGDGLVAGAALRTAEVLRSGLWLVGKADGIQTISSSFYVVVPPFRGGESEEVLTFSDCAVVPEPTAEQLSDIAIAAADARSAIVGDEPRVALLSFSTYGSGGDHPSVMKVRKALSLVKEKRPKLVVDGEMQVDSALVEATSVRKAPRSTIAGNANVLIFPSLDAGNIAYKLVQILQPKTYALGPILQGMKKPMSDLSRGASADDIVRIATIVAAQAE